MRIEIWQTDNFPNTTVLHLAGDLNTEAIVKLNELFQEILEKYPAYVVAEMSRVTLISSASLGRIMGFRQRLIEKDGNLVMAAPSLDIQSRLMLLGAHKVFKLHADVRSAVNAYKWMFLEAAEALELSFPSHLRYVPPVRQLISRIAAQKGYSHREAFRIETIIDEVCNNAIEHGQKGDFPVQLKFRIDRKKIELSVVNRTNPSKVDSLKHFTKTDGKPLPEELTGPRGRGLALIKMLSNNLNIDLSEEGTSVHVTRLRGE